MKVLLYYKTRNNITSRMWPWARHSDYGWCREPDMTIKPEKKLLFIAKVYYVRFGCKSIRKERCKCIRIDVECKEFCLCKRKCLTEWVSKVKLSGLLEHFQDYWNTYYFLTRWRLVSPKRPYVLINNLQFSAADLF